MVRRSGDCIMIAATLRHTAAAAANVNSEIHIATDSLFLLSLRLILLERAVNAEPCDQRRQTVAGLEKTSGPSPQFI
jgi:hypothetical protein